MTTINVNSSCEVLWVSRSDDAAIDAFFANNADAVDSVPGVFETLVNYGALWLAERGGNTSASQQTGNYLYPKGAGYSDVVACQWSKDINSPAGVFSMTVKPRIAWDKQIKPGDILVIFMDNDHRYGIDKRADGTLITIGIVDRIAKSTMVDGSGATVESISINGRDLGAIFQETQTIFDPTLAELDDVNFTSKFMQQASLTHVKGLSPVETIYRILDLVFNQNATGSEWIGGQWALGHVPQDASGRPVTLLSMLDVITFTQRPMPGYAIVQPLGLVQAGNVWTLMESYANRTLNEFFVDIRDIDAANTESIAFQGNQARGSVLPEDQASQDALAKAIAHTGVFNQSALQGIQSIDYGTAIPVPALVHRQMPYDYDAFMNLPFVDIDHTEVFGCDMGISSHEVANYFEIHFPDLPDISQEMIWGIKVNQRSFTKFGIRRFEAESRFPFGSSRISTAHNQGGVIDLAQPFAFYVGILSTWYATNETLLNGSMECRFKPQIRVGTRIRYHAVDGSYFHFYVQAVNQTFGVSAGASRTSLTIVRGFREGANDLAGNLIWNTTKGGDGEQIPDELLKFKRIKRIGINSDKPGQTIIDPSDTPEHPVTE